MFDWVQITPLTKKSATNHDRTLEQRLDLNSVDSKLILVIKNKQNAQLIYLELFLSHDLVIYPSYIVIMSQSTNSSSSFTTHQEVPQQTHQLFLPNYIQLTIEFSSEQVLIASFSLSPHQQLSVSIHLLTIPLFFNLYAQVQKDVTDIKNK